MNEFIKQKRSNNSSSTGSKLLWRTACIIILLICHTISFAQDDLDSNFALYEGESWSYIMEAPDDWVLDLENAQFDGLSAFFCPEEMTYFDAKLAISIWIFKLDSLTFREFISADSLVYLKSDSLIEFDKADSLNITDSQKVIVLSTIDPGGEYSLAMVGYIDAGAEIIIYELNLSAWRFYHIGTVKFKEAINNFSFVR